MKKQDIGKRILSVFLVVLMMLSFIPNGTIAYATGNSDGASGQILSFEAENPVTSVTYNTGDTVKLSDFPSELTAVVALNDSSLAFSQEKPANVGSYTVPANADELYTAGKLVVYTTSGGDHRIYGQAGEEKGWFACSSDGSELLGIVKELPIEWDISAINTATAGDYTAEASVDGYKLSCEPPKAAIRVNAKSGDQNIGTHTLTWVEEKCSSSAQVDGSELTLTPERNGYLNTQAVCQINFSLGGEENAPAGQIEIRVPAHIFSDRDGKPIRSVSVPLSKAPAEGGDTGFNYYIDTTTDEVVIKNYREIKSSYFFTCQISYNFTPFSVADGYSKDDIQASFQVQTESAGTLSTTSDKLKIQVETSVKAPRTWKNFNEKFETWQKSWGEAPDDAADYFYVEWKVDTIVDNETQPYTNTFIETPGSGGEVIGWRQYTNFTRGTEKDYEAHVFFQRSPSYTSNDWSQYTHYVIVRYPRALLEGGKIPTLENKITSLINGTDGDTKTADATAKYTYEKVNFEYEGDKFYVSKVGYEYMYGGINLLEKDRTAGNSFWIKVSSQGYSPTENGADDYTTVLADDLLFIKNEQLRPDDYTFTSFRIDALTEYAAVMDPDKGLAGIQSTDYSTYRPIDVYVKTVANPEDTKIGSLARTGASAYRWTPVGGEAQDVSRNVKISLPDGTYDVQFRHTGAQYRVEYSLNLDYVLNPTEHIKALVNGETRCLLYNIDSGYIQDKSGLIRTNGTPPTLDTTVKDAITKSDQSKYGQVVAHSYSWDQYTRLTPRSYFTKSAGKTVTDPSNSVERVEYTLLQYEEVSYSSPLTAQDVKDLQVITEQREGIFYDLLPLGTTIDPDSITVQTTKKNNDSQFRFDGGVSCRFTVESIDNWRNTGRTMVLIHAYAPDGTENYDINLNTDWGPHLYSGFRAKFTLINTWDNIRDNGTKVLNSAAYYSLSGNLASGLPDDGGKIQDKEWFYDLDQDGNQDASKKNVMYSEVNTYFTPLSADELGFRKLVKASGDTAYSKNTEAAAGGTYTYQLRLASGNNVETKNVILFDVLETALPQPNTSHWQGTLKSIDTTQVRKKGINAVVYYSTSNAFTNLSEDKTLTDLTNAELWNTQAPDNLGDVTAIAVDLRYKTDGSDYVFNPGETALCYVTMTAPENYRDYMDDPNTTEDETIYAYNSAYAQTTTTLKTGGEPKTAVEECPRVTVSLRGPDIELHKDSDPASGTAQAPTIVAVNDSIVYHLYTKNTGKTEAVKQVVITDTIPEGLDIDRENLKCYFGDSAAAAVLISKSSRVKVQVSEQTLTFTVDKLAAGETVHLLIPTKVAPAASNGMTFENVAKLTGFNEKSWDIESEHTWHKTDPVLTSVQATKTWVDDQNKYEKRPDSITVQLYADGVAVTGKTAELSEANNWNCTFADLVKYRADGQTEIRYTVLETTAVPGYAASYSDDGLTVTNTFQSKQENGSVTFRVQKYRSNSTIPVPGAVFVLKDSAGSVAASATTDETGVATFTLTPAGSSTYKLTLSEASAPSGYTPTTDTWTVKLTRNNEPIVTLDQNKNIFQIIWGWTVALFTGENSAEGFVNGTLTVYNDYSAAPTSIALSATKVLHGNKPLTDNMFTFDLSENGQSLMKATNKADGTITFAPLAYNEAGEHEYTITEEKGTLGGVDYDTASYTVKVSVIDDGNGHLVATPQYPENGVVFTNTYSVGGGGVDPSTTIKLSAGKTLTGKALEQNAFSFVVLENDAVVATGTNQADGTISFSAITYTAEGTHRYIVKELLGNLNGISYDSKEYPVTVNVTDRGDGTLAASAVYPDGGIIFRNAYNAAPVSVPLRAEKQLSGKTLTAGMFSFQLRDQSGQVIETVTNQADGAILFSSLRLEAPGTYIYTISEVNDQQRGMTYDDTVYTITIQVEDNGDGQLSANVTYPDGEAVFKNSYYSGGHESGNTPDPAKVILKAAKKLDGSAPADKVFTFVLKDVDGNVLQTRKNISEDITFAPIYFSRTGTYVYTISEVAGTESGICYDQTVFTVTIQVTKNRDYTAVVSYEKDGQPYEGTPTFENSTTSVPVPNPDVPTPNPDNPKPDAPTPNPDNPNPDVPTPNPDNPNPDAPTPNLDRPTDDVPRTDDLSQISLWFAVMLISLFGAVITFVISKKSSYRGKRVK